MTHAYQTHHQPKPQNKNINNMEKTKEYTPLKSASPTEMYDNETHPEGPQHIEF